MRCPYNVSFFLKSGVPVTILILWFSMNTRIIRLVDDFAAPCFWSICTCCIPWVMNIYQWSSHCYLYVILRMWSLRVAIVLYDFTTCLRIGQDIFWHYYSILIRATNASQAYFSNMCLGSTRYYQPFILFLINLTTSLLFLSRDRQTPRCSVPLEGSNCSIGIYKPLGWLMYILSYVRY